MPTEAEWEHAAQGGLDGATYPWGNDFLRKGRLQANTWQGAFPHQRLLTYDGAGTSPVKTFRPNDYGLFDVPGNVWEWTASLWTDNHAAIEPTESQACCLPSTVETERRVIKGGSHLYAPTYCHRYRPAARQGHAVRSTTNHVSLRCVRDV